MELSALLNTWNGHGIEKPHDLLQTILRISSAYDEESDHSNKAVQKTPEIESGHKVSEEVKWT